MLVFLALAAPLSAADEFADDKPLPAEYTGLDNSAVAREGETAVPTEDESIWGPILRLGVGVLVLAGLFAGFLWFVRRNPSMRKYFGTTGPLRLLSRMYLGSRKAVYLVKAGERVLVVGSGGDGLRTLSEITDPNEISRLLAEIGGQSEESAKGAFRSALKESLAEAEREGRRERPSRPEKRAAASAALPVPDRTPSGVESEATRRLAAIRAELEKLARPEGGKP